MRFETLASMQQCGCNLGAGRKVVVPTTERGASMTLAEKVYAVIAFEEPSGTRDPLMLAVA